VTEQAAAANERWDAYFYEPGGSVLRNKLDARSPVELAFVEYRMRAVRQGEIDRGEVDIPRTFGKEHLQAIHRHLLQDVYDWAGQFRDVGISKGGKGFVPSREVDGLVDKIGEKLVNDKDWSSMDRQTFVESIAVVHAYQNVVHPFREGNGATAKVYLAHVAELSPYKLDYDRVDKAEWNAASSDSRPADVAKDLPDPTKLHEVFDKITVEREPAVEADPELAKALELQNTTYAGIDESEEIVHGTGERPATHAVHRTAEVDAALES
jgi:cell filamentation protein